MDTYGTAYRDSEIRPYLDGLVKQYSTQPGGIVPEPIAEAVIAVETGETFDPTTYEPSSGAIGLGQITTTGQEWDWWKTDVDPNATAEQLADPEYNMDVMYYGLHRRHEEAEKAAFAGQPAAQRDWYMTTAGYLGGADNSGFNSAADSYGTTGPTYAKAVYDYIARTFGQDVATGIDKSQVGTAFADGYDKPARFDASADAGAEGTWIDRGANAGKKVLEKAASQVIDYLGNQIGALFSYSGPFLARAGLFVLGLALAVLGIRQVFA